jgi:Uma2 family endonuclease
MVTLGAAAAPIPRLDTQTYNRMVGSGVLDGQPVELIDGLLVEHMSPQGPEHAAVVERLTRHFASAREWLRIQLPLEVPPDSEPEPDLALLDREASPKQHPRTAVLVVEVAVTSHNVDRGSKTALYARAGVPTYWLVDVPARAVEVRTEPSANGYGRCEVFYEGALTLPSVAGVDDLELAALFAQIDMNSSSRAGSGS